MLHHSLARYDALVREWIYNLLARDVQFDIVGLSATSSTQPIRFFLGELFKRMS